MIILNEPSTFLEHFMVYTAFTGSAMFFGKQLVDGNMSLRWWLLLIYLNAVMAWMSSDSKKIDMNMRIRREARTVLLGIIEERSAAIRSEHRRLPIMKDLPVMEPGQRA